MSASAAGKVVASGASASLLTPKSKDLAMSKTDKAKNTAQEAKGKVKEVAGRIAGDDDLEREGKTDQTKANLKQAGEKVKDAFRN